MVRDTMPAAGKPAIWNADHRRRKSRARTRPIFPVWPMTGSDIKQVCHVHLVDADMMAATGLRLDIEKK